MIQSNELQTLAIKTKTGIIILSETKLNPNWTLKLQ